MPPSPPRNFDYNVLLVAAKFTKGNLYFDIDWGKGGSMLKFVFLDVHFETEEKRG